MQEISTLKRNWKPLAFSIIGLVMSVSALTTTAQTLCPNQVTLWSENFGTGTGSTTSADVTTLVYAPGNFPTTWLNDGFYRVSNGTQQRGDWHASADHTPSDVDGRALVINGVAETFYTKEISSNSVYNPGIYGFGFYLMNVNTNNYPCSPYLLPTISYVIEYSTAPSGNSWVTLQSVSGTPAPITNAPVWLSMGGTFSLPVAAQRFRITLSDGTSDGCGNDFAIDDLSLVQCDDGGPMPVEFLKLSATQKGSGVSVNWSTATEVNNAYFEVERSTDGYNWTAISRVNGSGNSNMIKNYNSYDSKPSAGYNFYRIKQVDIDGGFEYSSTVKVKITIDKLGVNVLANPFVNNITVDFLSNTIETVNIRLTDISGKTVAIERWQIAKGSTRKVFDKVGGLQRGMYILTVTDKNGMVVYNNKLMKQ